MKNILIINAHWNNRGDQAAIYAMLDELLKMNKYRLKIQIKAINVEQFDYSDVNLIPMYPRLHDLPELFLGMLTHGKLLWSSNGKVFFKVLDEADVVVHAPGGPSIGDIYSISEITYLAAYLAIMKYKKKIFFYAPSMGPFHNRIRNIIRKKLFNYADKIVIRENISKSYLDELLPDNKAIVTLDSAFQNEIDSDNYVTVLDKYLELKQFLNTDKKVIGMTITDLSWHPVYSKTAGLSEQISKELHSVVDWLHAHNYRVLLIPQLFGEANDYNYMSQFITSDCFVMSDKYSSYFQQFIIGKLHAVIGMRYHSNIFSAKMLTPFVSISYEQKMKGFIRKLGYEEYCIDIKDMNASTIIDKFERLEKNYQEIKDILKKKQPELMAISHKTTELLLDILE